jgi:hypothetical protein
VARFDNARGRFVALFSEACELEPPVTKFLITFWRPMRCAGFSNANVAPLPCAIGLLFSKPAALALSWMPLEALLVLLMSPKTALLLGTFVPPSMVMVLRAPVDLWRWWRRVGFETGTIFSSF